MGLLVEGEPALHIVLASASRPDHLETPSAITEHFRDSGTGNLKVPDVRARPPRPAKGGAVPLVAEREETLGHTVAKYPDATMLAVAFGKRGGADRHENPRSTRPSRPNSS